jgi:Flp pilus assembly pilin Flp
MLPRLSNHRGQNTAEYAIVIALIIGAVIAMQTYVKRGLQGRMKDATDYVATETKDIGTTKQYEPYYAEQEMTVGTKTRSTADTSEGGGKQTDTEVDTTRIGYQEYKDTAGQD